MLTLDDEDYELLGYGNHYETALTSERLAYLLAQRRESARRYSASENGKERNRRHNMTDARKQKKVASEMRYQSSDKGKIVVTRARAKYAASEKGKASIKRAQAAYRARQKAKTQ